MRHHRILTAVASLGLATAGLALVTQPADAAPDPRCARTNDTVKKLMECVTLEGVMEHQEAFQDIADDNGGTRASGTDGYDASVDYVDDRLTRAGYVVSRQVVKTPAQVLKWGGTAGDQFDPCYHAECDTIDNLSPYGLDLNSDAVAYAMLSYAAGYEVINQP